MTNIEASFINIIIKYIYDTETTQNQGMNNLLHIWITDTWLKNCIASMIMKASLQQAHQLNANKPVSGWWRFHSSVQVGLPDAVC